MSVVVKFDGTPIPPDAANPLMNNAEITARRHTGYKEDGTCHKLLLKLETLRSIGAFGIVPALLSSG